LLIELAKPYPDGTSVDCIVKVPRLLQLHLSKLITSSSYRSFTCASLSNTHITIDDDVSEVVAWKPAAGIFVIAIIF
jgi:hypothetical protein